MTDSRAASYEYDPKQVFIDLHAFYLVRYPAHKVDLADILARSLADDSYDIDFGVLDMLDKYEEVYERLVNPSDYVADAEDPTHWASFV